MKTIIRILMVGLAVAAFFLPEIAQAGGFMAAVGAGVTISPSRNRAILSKLANQFQGAVIQPSHLRVDVAISTNSNQWNFNIVPGTSDLTYENKLNKNDVFAVTDLGIFLYKQNTTDLGSDEVLQTYPNATYFAAGTNFSARFLESFYNGKLRIQVQDRVFVESLDTKRFRHVPDAQQGTTSAAVISSVNAITAYTLAHSAFKLEDGMCQTDPTIYLNGDLQNTIQLNIPLGPNYVLVNDVANTTNYVSFYALGFLVKGGANAWKNLDV